MFILWIGFLGNGLINSGGKFNETVDPTLMLQTAAAKLNLAQFNLVLRLETRSLFSLNIKESSYQLRVFLQWALSMLNRPLQYTENIYFTWTRNCIN